MKYKLLITIIGIILFCMICYELTYTKMLYEECQYYVNNSNYHEERFNKLWNIHLEVINEGGN